MDRKREEQLKPLARETTDQLRRIAAAANAKLADPLVLGPDSLASINTLTSPSAIKTLSGVGQAVRESYIVLAAEPAIARVVVAERDGKERIYYICRAAPVSGISNLASYRAPVGRLASLSRGSEFVLPDGTIVEVVERAHLHPVVTPDGWDSRQTVVEAKRFTVTVASMRALIAQTVGDAAAEDLLAQLLSEEAFNANIIDGVRHSVITKMGLRDQPILDQYQDEIFRLPLNNRLLILGPPGTGKTTTLIRRLGQKLDSAFLEERERIAIDSLNASSGIAHANSWLMFTPTELLKQYLKEAFAREGVPASDLRIRTWHDHRRELARNVFGVLRTAAGRGTFVLKDAIRNLDAEALARPIQCFADFDDWQRNAFVEDLREAAGFLSQAHSSDVRDVGRRVLSILVRGTSGGLAPMFEAIAVEMPNVQALVSRLKDASDAAIKAALNRQLNLNRAFLDDLALFIDELQRAQATDVDDDELEADEEEEGTPPPTARAAAVNAYMRAARAQARAAASKRTLGKSSRVGKIIDWLGDRALAKGNRSEVGVSLLTQTSARRFVNPVKGFMDGIPRRYRTFRRQRQAEGVWYQQQSFEVRDIHPLELDIVLLAILRATNDLIGRPNVLRDIDSPAWSSLRAVLGHFQNQILVDEATDFSPIQLACMGALAHPRMRSFFACGDFNQRLTIWGTRSVEDVRWVFPDIDIKKVTVSYRLSKQLADLARALIQSVEGAEQMVRLPPDVSSIGVAPALLDSTRERSAVSWLADRIREIEHFVGELPSTAIFVSSEDEVGPIAEALNEALTEHNIQVLACREGQAIGQESNVRVFDIQHIKGLEFEAVFFVAIDKLERLQPELFDKYLYVGITRAATYLGVTCDERLPSALESVRPHFVKDWQNESLTSGNV